VDDSYQKTRLTLPHDFVGLLTIKCRYGTVKPFSSRVHHLSEINGVTKCFVGDLRVVGTSP
jgi:hypothetical protein